MSEFDGPTPALTSESEVTWDAEAIRAFVNAPDGAVGRTLLKAAYKVETDAIRRCPVDTGRLRASITHAMGTDPTGLFADVLTDVEYAPYVEFGTSRAPAQPFLRPALDVLAGGLD